MFVFFEKCEKFLLFENAASVHNLKLLKLTRWFPFLAPLCLSFLLAPLDANGAKGEGGRGKRRGEKGGRRRRREEEEEEGKEGREKASCMISQGGKTATGGKESKEVSTFFWTPFLNTSFGDETDLTKGTTTLLFFVAKTWEKKKKSCDVGNGLY